MGQWGRPGQRPPGDKKVGTSLPIAHASAVRDRRNIPAPTTTCACGDRPRPLRAQTPSSASWARSLRVEDARAPPSSSTSRGELAETATTALVGRARSPRPSRRGRLLLSRLPRPSLPLAARDLGFEGVELLLPEGAKLIEPLRRFHQRAWVDGVEAALGVDADGGEAGIAQDSEVLGDGGLGDAELAVDDVADGAGGLLAADEELEDAPADGVAQDTAEAEVARRGPEPVLALGRTAAYRDFLQLIS
jgi:hypothetical protein